ncbi:MAG: hypothetical protein IV089_01030 [Thiobacillus sp.]|nr:hypothetical protein [Thiobacillus sp.]
MLSFVTVLAVAPAFSNSVTTDIAISEWRHTLRLPLAWMLRAKGVLSSFLLEAAAEWRRFKRATNMDEETGINGIDFMASC